MVEKKDEIKHKDFCIEEFNTDQLQADHKELQTENHQLRRMLNSARNSLKNWVSDLTWKMCNMGIGDSVNREEESIGYTDSSSRGDDGSDSAMDDE